MGVFLKLRRIMRLDRREEGVAAVEFALCLIPLVLILGIILDGGLEMFVSLTLSYGSRGGARYMTHYQSSGGLLLLLPKSRLMCSILLVLI